MERLVLSDTNVKIEMIFLLLYQYIINFINWILAANSYCVDATDGRHERVYGNHIVKDDCSNGRGRTEQENRAPEEVDISTLYIYPIVAKQSLFLQVSRL